MQSFMTKRLALLNLGLFAALIAWDASGLDLVLARWMGDTSGFPLRDNWWLTHVLHDGARYTAWALTLMLCAMVTFPFGGLSQLPFTRRMQLPVTALLGTAVVSLLKTASGTSCPWDLAEFGGVAHYMSHWSGWLVHDGGAGRCFPAGHASAGFAFVGGYFALREPFPGLARAWLSLALAAGFALGLAQQWRGAHFMSHTLWTGWLCWMVACLSEPLAALREA